MNLKFAEITDKELNKNLYKYPMDYIYKPYTNIKNFAFDIASIAILPCYYLSLAILVLVETIRSLSFIFYYHIKSEKKECNQSLEKIKKSLKIELKIVLATIFIAPLMLFLVLFRLIVTVISFTYKFLNLEKEALKDKSLINKEMQALSEINQLFDKIDEDKSLINETLENFNAELAGLIKNDQEYWERKCVKLKHKLKKHHIFKEPEEIIILRREKINTTELSHTLAELMDSYPETTLYMTSTLDEIKDFYRDLEEHHEKVVSVAEKLFPNIVCFLNMNKQIDKTNSQLNCRSNNV